MPQRRWRETEAAAEQNPAVRQSRCGICYDRRLANNSLAQCKGLDKAMLTGLTVGFDCPPGLLSLVGNDQNQEMVRLVPQGEVDACLLVSRRPLFAHTGQLLQSEQLLDEVLGSQPQFRVVRRSPAEQVQSSAGRMHLLRVVGWHGEPKIALGQLVALFSPSNPALPPCAAVAIFLWYTEKAGRKYAPQAMALFRSLRILPLSQQSWPPSEVLLPQT
ncbi:MAG TPA: hypothetical protein PKE31_01580 [Pseudomonadota bacterium]|nr:hypothetical protein [Pseudomonadota bacterium]